MSRANVTALDPLRFVAPEPSPWDIALQIRDAAMRMSVALGRHIDPGQILDVVEHFEGKPRKRVRTALRCL